MFIRNITLISCVLLVIGCLVYGCFSASLNRVKNQCNQIPEPVLSEILGPAFNSRYMSIDQPSEINDDQLNQSPKRALSNAPSFYVDDQYQHEVSDVPAWKTSHTRISRWKNSDGSSTTTTRSAEREKRAMKPVRQWECESKIRWLDLGTDYFPRYLRSVECTSKTCWYDMMQCKPRSFTVKILRRKRDRCIEDAGFKVGSVGLPQDLRELWIWEERAVNFCCDCAM